MKPLVPAINAVCFFAVNLNADGFYPAILHTLHYNYLCNKVGDGTPILERNEDAISGTRKGISPTGIIFEENIPFLPKLKLALSEQILSLNAYENLRIPLAQNIISRLPRCNTPVD